jgi:hypothetical protein
MRWVDTAVDRARWRATLAYRPLSRLMVGVEYNPAEQEATPLASLFLLHESRTLPAAFLGTSSDRIGSPEGTQCYFLTAMKAIPSLPVSVYGTANWSEWDDELNFPFGADFDLGRGLSFRPMYDGHRTHLTATYARSRMSVTALWVWLEKPGLSVSFGF